MNEIILFPEVEPEVDFSKGCMHTSHTMPRCPNPTCGASKTLMITGIVGKFLFAQHKCAYCEFSKVYRKDLEGIDMPTHWGEQLREFQREYVNYQVWPPIMKQKEIEHATYIERKEDNESDEETLRSKKGKGSVLRKLE